MQTGSSIRLTRRTAMKGVAASLALAAVGSAVTSAAAQDASPAASPVAAAEGTPEIVVQLLTAFQNEDLDGAVALFTPDGVFDHEGYGVKLTGTDQLRFLHKSIFQNNDNIRFTNVTGFQNASGDRVAAEATWTAIDVYDVPGGHPGPDQVTFNFGLFGDVTDGKFSRVAIYYDSYREQVQTGVLPPIQTGTPPA